MSPIEQQARAVLTPIFDTLSNLQDTLHTDEFNRRFNEERTKAFGTKTGDEYQAYSTVWSLLQKEYFGT